LTAEFETFVREEDETSVELRNGNHVDDREVSSGKKILKNIELSHKKYDEEKEVNVEKPIEKHSNGDVKMREVTETRAADNDREETPDYIPLTVREKFHVLRIEEDHDLVETKVESSQKNSGSEAVEVQQKKVHATEPFVEEVEIISSAKTPVNAQEEKSTPKSEIITNEVKVEISTNQTSQLLKSHEKPPAAEEPKAEVKCSTEVIFKKMSDNATDDSKILNTEKDQEEEKLSLSEEPLAEEVKTEKVPSPKEQSPALVLKVEEKRLVVEESPASKDFDDSVNTFERVAEQLSSPQPSLNTDIYFRREFDESKPEPVKRSILNDSTSDSNFKNDSGYLSFNTSNYDSRTPVSDEMIIVRTKIDRDQPRVESTSFQSDPVIVRESSQVTTFRSSFKNPEHTTSLLKPEASPKPPIREKPAIAPKPIVREKTPIPKSYTESGISFTRRNFVSMEPTTASRTSFERESVELRRDGKVPPTPPPRRRSIKDVIESINRNQQLLKINQTAPAQSRCYEYTPTSPNLDKYQQQQAESEKKINEILDDLQNYTK
jgi:hypothetical protein